MAHLQTLALKEERRGFKEQENVLNKQEQTHRKAGGEVQEDEGGGDVGSGVLLIWGISRGAGSFSFRWCSDMSCWYR